ncbi:hypothetical protein BmR1_04g04955 [Babesia microti strain RI]|uniref:RAP domain-containing protein n=1 Tax=Babesia microti (strain RI) TaxID=1133968 RepID=I7JCH3_BABMR|nr:hypothetical protein BmR1_04g04955 [Babesia microti strain RI]CCF75190.1 hypothetical protein BmR1_04g04955 [Babesia microti strain RI]|eukprot:XP_012649598.1 hypothetical protein BmR1_04g04955 [Babesia microti strain RI]
MCNLPLVESYLERYLRVSSGKWCKLVLNLTQSDAKPEFLLGYQRHLRALTTFKLVKLLRKCTEIGLRCDINGNDFLRAGLTEFVRRFKCSGSNDGLDVVVVRDISYVLRRIRFCQADTSQVSVCCISVCSSCTNLYGELLNYAGSELLLEAVKLLGTKIVNDGYKIRRVKGSKHLSESAITPYFEVIGSINLEFCNKVRQLSILYRKCIIQSKSLLNIATVLHVLSKIGCRCGLLKKKLLKQLSYNKLLQLLNNEKSDSTKQISIGQLICSALHLSSTRMAGLSHTLLCNLTRIIVEKWSFGSLHDSLKSQMALYHSYITTTNVNVDDRVKEVLNAIKRDFVQIRPKPMIKSVILEPLKWKTTVFQQQVSNLLKEMGYDIDCEVHIYPYIVDILVDNKVIIEVNGPCHYTYHCSDKNDYGVINSALKLNKNTILKEKLLNGCGYKVIHVSYADWPSDKDSQISKLAALLDAT